MTCLTSADVINIPSVWDDFDRRMMDILGVDLLTLAARAVDRPVETVRRGLAGRKLAAVSITNGVGVVPGFAESLAAIGRHLGMSSAVMQYPDGHGFQQALDLGAEIIISADDFSFMARETKHGRLADNNPATSNVFVAALELMNGGSLRDSEVIVLGCGPIGRGAVCRLAELGAYPLVFDPDEKKVMAVLDEIEGEGEQIRTAEQMLKAVKRTSLIFEATPVSQALPPEMWPAKPVVAAPGVPLAWPWQWMEPGSPARLWHDVLQSGTAAMLAKLA